MRQISSYIEKETQFHIRRMELSSCKEIHPNHRHRLPIGSIFTNPINGVTLGCLQRIASLQVPTISNQTIVSYPEGVGLPIGPSTDRSVALLLTIEYDQDARSIRDSSGFDLYLHDEVMPISAGIVAIGFSPDTRFFLPPKLNRWSTKAICHSGCLSQVGRKGWLWISGMLTGRFLWKMSEPVRIAGIVPSTEHRLLERLVVEISSANQSRPHRIFSWGSDASSIELTEEPVWGPRDKVTAYCTYRTENRTVTVGRRLSGRC